MARLVECIPNFSEARRPEVVEQIRQAICIVPGVNVLDQHSDLDHNRTVITFAGSPLAVEEAAFRAIKTAAELIDMNQHTGEHPRIGATDVCPFVPLSDATMEECIAIARRLGQRVGSELNIPVYLYESAATRPERTNFQETSSYDDVVAPVAQDLGEVLGEVAVVIDDEVGPHGALRAQATGAGSRTVNRAPPPGRSE